MKIPYLVCSPSRQYTQLSSIHVIEPRHHHPTTLTRHPQPPNRQSHANTVNTRHYSASPPPPSLLPVLRQHIQSLSLHWHAKLKLLTASPTPKHSILVTTLARHLLPPNCQSHVITLNPRHYAGMPPLPPNCQSLPPVASLTPTHSIPVTMLARHPLPPNRQSRATRPTSLAPLARDECACHDYCHFSSFDA